LHFPKPHFFSTYGGLVAAKSTRLPQGRARIRRKSVGKHGSPRLASLAAERIQGMGLNGKRQKVNEHDGGNAVQ
jgi:hypothetical protein